TLIAVAARTRWRQGAGMRQRPLQQGRVAKAVADALLQRSIELALTVGGHRCEAQIIGWPKRNRGRVRRSIEFKRYSTRNRRSQRTVQGHCQNIQAEAFSSTEKKMISARPTKFSNGT